MSDNNQKENNKVSIKPFIILFGLSIIIFGFLYFCHSKNIENRFDNTLQNYEKSMSYIFNNIITNGVNENIYTNSFQTNNNQLQNDSIENLKLSFEVGFKMLESSMNEIMKNSNDILQFWFAFLSIIMIVFTLIGFFVSSNILNQAREQLEIIKEKSNILIKELENEYNNAIKDINKTGEKESKNLTEESDLFNKGLQAYNNGDYQSSIYYFNEVVKLNSKNYQAYNNRGIAKSNLAKTKEKNSKEYNELMKEAMEDYNKAIELNSNYSLAYNNRGIAKSELKLFEETIEDFNKVIELNPNYSEAYNNRGIAKSNLAKTKEKNSEEYNQLMKEAMEDYNKAIELNSNYLKAYNNRGNIKSDLANSKEQNSEEYNQLMKEAMEDYNKAIELNSNYSTAYNNRGFAKLELGKTEEAIKDFIKAYELDNDKEAKEYSKNELIKLAQEEYKEHNHEAIEFCKKYNIDYKIKNDNEDKN